MLMSMRLLAVFAGVLAICAAQEPAPPPAPANPPGTNRIGGGVTGPRVVSKVQPEYSEEARQSKFQGTVVLSVVVARTAIRETSK